MYDDIWEVNNGCTQLTYKYSCLEVYIHFAFEEILEKVLEFSKI